MSANNLNPKPDKSIPLSPKVHQVKSSHNVHLQKHFPRFQCKEAKKSINHPSKRILDQAISSKEPIPEEMSRTISDTKSARETAKYKPQIQDFEGLELIGAGNFGKVFKAYNKVTREVSALKQLPKENVVAMKQADHIITECEILTFLTMLKRDPQVGGLSPS
jgi:hypothetical protein